MPSVRCRILGISFLASVICWVVLTWSAHELGKSVRIKLGPISLCIDPIIQFELARTSEESAKLLGKWHERERAVAGFNLGFDFVFILAYGTFLTLACCRAANFWGSKTFAAAWVGRIIIVTVIAAPICDVVEDIALLKQLISVPQPPWPQIAFWCATVKFSAIGVGAIYLAMTVCARLRTFFMRHTLQRS